MKGALTKLIVIAVVGVVLFALNLMRRMEMYCVFWPSIDTRYAPGFTEAKFSTIRVGDSAERVATVLGSPLSRSTTPKGVVVWYYTGDGKARWLGDFAWLLRSVWMSNDVVVAIERETIYN